MKRHDGWDQDSTLWNGFWSAIASGFARRTASSSSSTAQFVYQPTTTTSMSQSTILVTVPATTIYVSTTIISTTFVTLPGQTVPRASISTESSVEAIPPQDSTSPSISDSSAASTSLTSYSPPAVTQVMSSPASASPSAGNSTTGSLIGQQTRGGAQKHAIIGGLSGSIAGLVLVGALICLVLRMRRRKVEGAHADDSSNEKGLRPALIRKWTQLTGAGIGTPKQTDMEQTSMSPVSVDEEHRIIRMNTRHWLRPFTAGTGEGYRENQPQGALRVVNPDASRPGTPRKSTDTALDHFMKQRPSLAGFVFGVPKQSPEARLQNYPAQKPIPSIQVTDPNLSRECIATYEATPSFRSYPSVASGPIVRHQTPDDPFVSTPPTRGSSAHSAAPAPIIPRRRPSLTAMHSGPESAGRTWQQLSSHLLHPFARRQSVQAEPVQNVRGLSHFSASSSATRSSQRSDPFDLSIRGSQPPREAAEFRRGSPNPNWILYEGT